MKVLLFVTVFVFSSLGFAEEHSATPPSSQRAKSEIPSKQKEQAMRALSLLFEEPKTGEKQTFGYKGYLRYKIERPKLFEKFLNATNPQQRTKYNQDLNRLDQDFRLKYSRIEMAVNVAWAMASRVFMDKQTLPTIRDHAPKEYKKWDDSRRALLVDFRQAKNARERARITRDLSMLDQEFRLRFLGFLLSR